jgi:PAS domain S-box-containing protein
MQTATPGSFIAERLFGVGPRRFWPALAQLILLGLAVCCAAALSLSLTRHAGGPPALWTANAFVLVCLMRTSRRRWPSLVIAAALGQALALAMLTPLLTTLRATACDTLEIVACASFMRYVCGRRMDLSQPRTLAAFAAMVVAGPALSGVLMVMTAGEALNPVMVNRLIVWFCAHSLGFLVITPVLLSLRPRTLKRIAAKPANIGLLLGYSILLFGLFQQTLIPPQGAIIALVVLITFRMEQFGAAIAAFIAAVMGMGFLLYAASTQGFAATDFANQLLAKQIALAIVTGCALAIGATLAHRRRLRTSLKMSLARAEAARAEAVEAMRQTLMAEQVAGIGFWRWELATGKVNWSAEMFRIWGMEETDNPDLGAGLNMVHPDDKAVADENIERAMRETEPFHSRPVRLLLPDGSIRHLAGRMSSERNAQGEVTALRGALVDISYLKLADEAVRASEARYRLLADHSSDIIVRVDLQDRILYVSPSCRTLGYEPEELVGRLRWELTHPDDLQTLTKVRANLVQGAPSSRADREYRFMTKDGRWVWMEGSPSIIRNEDGLPIEMVSQLRDISERKAFETDLMAARDDAEAAARAKSEFLANMSHEIRTPLTSIMGFSSLLQETGGLPDAAGRYVQRIATAGQSLLSVVNDILDFSKLEAGQVDLDPHGFDPAAFVEDTVELLTTQAENKGLTLGLIIDDSVPARIDADSARVRQVLLNLVGNAIKFTAEGRVSVSMSHADGMMRIQVADTGPGIPAERRDRLFQRFSQVDGSVSRNHGGTGLGLAICKGLVRLMGGEIGVDSEEDRGSVFWFTFAAPPADMTVETAAPVADEVDMRPLRMLVVDDVNVNRELVRAMLEPFGHTFVEAENGAEAVAAALREPFDLILMDLQMPGMDGASATRAIRANCTANGLTPILALSANVLPDHLVACAAAGMDDHIGKPIQPMRLLTKVAEWGRQRHVPNGEDRLRA